jgi:hypothetical protein
MMMMRTTLYNTNRLSLIFIVLTHWNNSLRIDTWHIIPIPSQPICALSSKWCVLSGEARNTNFIVFGLTALEASTSTITPLMQLSLKWNKKGQLEAHMWLPSRKVDLASVFTFYWFDFDSVIFFLVHFIIDTDSEI